MKEKPIIFSPEMVRAILEDRKTQTRRVIKSQPPANYHSPGFLINATWAFHKPSQGHIPHIVKCPYGQTGDRLWVRETWAQKDRGQILTKADYNELVKVVGLPEVPIKWRPSIHMPRWASHITLEITEVRVEGVQQIGANDACAEGIGDFGRSTPQKQFALLWDSLNAKRGYGWKTNPWVWVISFKRINYSYQNT